MKILVISNYLPDKQKSMEKYASIICDMYKSVSAVEIHSPPALSSKLPFSSRLAKKYLAYIDKLILFPIWLLVNSYRFQFIHIADHGNSFYSFFCPQKRTIVTCHDLLAVRGAFGDSSVYCDASSLGPFLQQLIIAGLLHSSKIIFVSNATYKDFLDLTSPRASQKHQTIPNPLNENFECEASFIHLSSHDRSLLPKNPYLLMVGSSLPRKNRICALNILRKTYTDLPFYLVFAGAPLTESERIFQIDVNCGNRLISIPNPSHSLLNMLYCKAHALLFPSFSEGFGWPLIEAQASGCPVIASTCTCIPEVAGKGALFADPLDVSTFINHVTSLMDSKQRRKLIELGFANLQRYNYDNISSAYRNFITL